MAPSLFLRPWWSSIPPGAAWIKACAVSAHDSIGFRLSFAPAPVPSKSRTSSVTGGHLREKIQAQELTLKERKEKRRQTHSQGLTRGRTLCSTQDRKEALHRHHQTHCLSRRERPGGRNP